MVACWTAVLPVFLAISVSLNLCQYLGLGSAFAPALGNGNARPIGEVESTRISLVVSDQARSASASTRQLSDIADPHHGIGNHSNLSNASAHDEASHHASPHVGGHPHDALVYMFFALVIGGCVMHLNTYWTKMQGTVVLFVLGMVIAIVLRAAKATPAHLGVFSTSFTMWLGIDPHLLLFTMLPALLAGDAMTIDTHVAKHVAWQCLYMAGPGVVINAFAVATFLFYYMDAVGQTWDFLLCLTTGSILCATDPVAVVALLKELGASPILTVQIQGESLLNDGTAIVLFLIAYNKLSLVEYDAADIIMFLVKTAMLAWALGMFIGYFFVTWIRAAGNKLKHGSSMIQITLTICCAYVSFILAEGVFHISGVLACVASSLVLADHMWPHIVSKASLHHVWHMIESLGNILIFFLAGSISGNVFYDIDPINVLHLIVVYIVLVLFRGLFIFGSRPILYYLSPVREPVTMADAAVMTWGGLRGAVGLALAIQVYNDRAPDKVHGIPQISVQQAEVVIFFVSGVAFLTTIVNATTAPALVNWLGITALPAAQQKLMKMVYTQLVNWSVQESNPPEVTEGIRRMLADIEQTIDNTRVSKSTVATSLRTTDSSPIAPRFQRQQSPISHFFQHEGQATDNTEITEALRASEAVFQKLSPAELELLGDLPLVNLLGQVDEMVTILGERGVDIGMAKVVNKAFLALVSRNYWKLMDKGELAPGSHEATMLLTSVRMAESPLEPDLQDWSFIVVPKVQGAESGKEWWKVFPDDGTQTRTNQLQAGSLQKLVRSSCFNTTMAVAIVLNCISVGIDEAAGDGSIAFLLVEVFFTIVFVIEFVLKFLVVRLKYFKDGSNIFDFALVVLGIFGVVVGVASHSGSSTSSASSARIIRIARVFRVLRFLRIFRLFHAKLGMDSEVSVEVMHHMTRITIWMSYAKAHLASQVQLVKYFGGNGKIDEVDEAEIARCILQSQIGVYSALTSTLAEKKAMDHNLLMELRATVKRKAITENLEKFILEAHHDGALSAGQAESILHPLHHQIKECCRQINAIDNGFVGKRCGVESSAIEAKVHPAVES